MHYFNFTFVFKISTWLHGEEVILFGLVFNPGLPGLPGHDQEDVARGSEDSMAGAGGQLITLRLPSGYREHKL